MLAAKVVEIHSESSRRFDDAIRQGTRRGAGVAEQKLDIEAGAIVRCRLTTKVTFVLAD
jgi:hypothetical protein